MAARIAEIERRMEAACARCGRKRHDVTLIAVSKRQPSSLIRCAFAHGLRDFGENYAQELRDKSAELSDLPALRWHFIGPLQRNKVRHVVGRAAVIHSVDSVALLERIDRTAAERAHVQDILLQLNLSGEPQKSGAPPDSLEELLAAISALAHVRCMGLMTLPPAVTLAQDAAPYFARLREIRDAGGVKIAPTCVHLSMGMSHDFEVACQHGATMVRIGSAIFGQRV